MSLLKLKDCSPVSFLIPCEYFPKSVFFNILSDFIIKSLETLAWPSFHENWKGKEEAGSYCKYKWQVSTAIPLASFPKYITLAQVYF